MADQGITGGLSAMPRTSAPAEERSPLHADPACVGQVSARAQDRSEIGGPAGRTFAWDLDGAGTFATSSPGSLVTVTYATADDHVIKLRVTNDAGQSHIASTSVQVASLGIYWGRPMAPTNITFTPAPDHSSGRLSWSPPSGPLIEGYEVISVDDGTPIALLGRRRGRPDTRLLRRL
ncbi:PKD domain-containing protein [Saccharothrix deserti]|uniref:PKD domain-containing protein n=1 Tax=Saccharothrix deserti TaxID=2593674 RepID=UPI00131C43D4|nr:PKD domain-containing protein [Saccharothrix deserti]